MEYSEYIKSKTFKPLIAGFKSDDIWSVYPTGTKPFQLDCVQFCSVRGRAALFADTGLGKTLMELIWAMWVAQYTGRPVLIVTPLCVAQQTVREGVKFGINAKFLRSPENCEEKIHVTNYEMLKNFSPSDYSGIVLDESSILKGMNGAYRKHLTEFAATIPYRLSATATPSPNDFMELGTQAEFLGIMTQTEMLATFFIHDGSDTSKWRLKGHAKRKFWEWLATWAVFISKPSDLGYEDKGYDLPPLNIIEHIVDTEATNGLFVDVAQGLTDRLKARRETIDVRAEKASELMRGFDCVVCWSNLNDESKLITELVEGCEEITGSMDYEVKESRLLGFSNGDIKKISTKSSIAGFGLNWQHCNNTVYLGLSDSWEKFYQSVRRFYRFGQTKEVNAHVVISDREIAVLDNIRRKKTQDEHMRAEMQSIMGEFLMEELRNTSVRKTPYAPQQQIKLPGFLK